MLHISRTVGRNVHPEREGVTPKKKNLIRSNFTLVVGRQERELHVKGNVKLEFKRNEMKSSRLTVFSGRVDLLSFQGVLV